jgi:hypothetical protein
VAADDGLRPGQSAVKIVVQRTRRISAWILVGSATTVFLTIANGAIAVPLRVLVSRDAGPSTDARAVFERPGATPSRDRRRALVTEFPE